MNYEIESVLRVNCEKHGFGAFFVLVLPRNGILEFYIGHAQYDVLLYMFGCNPNNNEEAAALAFEAAPRYMAEYLEQCFNY